jgi:hypothetical protein
MDSMFLPDSSRLTVTIRYDYLSISASGETLADEDANQFHAFFACLQVFDFGRVEQHFFVDHSV